MVSYSALFDPDLEAGGFVVTFPDVPGCLTQGEDLAEATAMAADALELMLDYMMRQGEPLPEAKPRRGKHMRPVALSPIKSAKIELYRAFQAAGLRKAELARLMGIQKANVDRLFRLSHPSTFEQLETAFRVLGKRLVIGVEDAA
jgi:antitoxin HicB